MQKTFRFSENYFTNQLLPTTPILLYLADASPVKSYEYKL